MSDQARMRRIVLAAAAQALADAERWAREDDEEHGRALADLLRMVDALPRRRSLDEPLAFPPMVTRWRG